MRPPHDSWLSAIETGGDAGLLFSDSASRKQNDSFTVWKCSRLVDHPRGFELGHLGSLNGSIIANIAANLFSSLDHQKVHSDP